MASTPQFLGANPAEVRAGPQKGTRALPAEEDLGRALVTSLSAGQQTEAVLSKDAPKDILTGNSREAAIQEDKGIRYRKLTHANHIHCVWREFKGDWGPDLLAEHYRAAPHHANSRSGDRDAKRAQPGVSAH